MAVMNLTMVQLSQASVGMRLLPAPSTGRRATVPNVHVDSSAGHKLPNDEVAAEILPWPGRSLGPVAR